MVRKGQIRTKDWPRQGTTPFRACRVTKEKKWNEREKKPRRGEEVRVRRRRMEERTTNDMTRQWVAISIESVGEMAGQGGYRKLPRTSQRNARSPSKSVICSFC